MKTKILTLAIVYAALYTALSLFLSPISFGAIQVRVAGLLLGAVPVLGIAGVIGQTLGCFITNSFSPLGLIDLINVIPTFIMSLMIWKLRNKSVLLGLSLYSIVTSISIAFTLNYAFNLPVGITILTVLAGQIISCIIGGYIIHKTLSRRKTISNFY
jgi:uncharacterized membrane protein